MERSDVAAFGWVPSRRLLAPACACSQESFSKDKPRFQITERGRSWVGLHDLFLLSHGVSYIRLYCSLPTQPVHAYAVGLESVVYMHPHAQFIYRSSSDFQGHQTHGLR